MRPARKRLLTRKRLLIAGVVIAAALAAAWFGGRYPLARWAVRRTLAAAGLEPAAFQVDSVGFGSLHVTNLSVGSPAWLAANHVEITFTLRDLLATRVNTIRLTGALWTVQSRSGVIDWGYIARKSAGPLNLDLPLNLIEVADSVVRIVKDGAVNDVQFAGRFEPTGPGALTANLDLAALGRQATLTARIKSDDQHLTIDTDGHARNPDAAPQARWHAMLRHEQSTGAMQADLELTLDAITEQVRDIKITLAHASLIGHAELDGRGITRVTSTINARALQIGGVALHTADLTATTADGAALELEIAATGEGWKLPGARATAHWDPSAGSLTAAMRTEQPVLINLEAAGITGQVESIEAEARLQMNESAEPSLAGRVALTGGKLQAGDLALTDARADAVIRDLETIDINSLAATVGDGSTITVEPFTWNPQLPRAEARITVINLSMAHWLPIISNQRATGDGRVSGHANVTLDWSTGSPKLEQLTGDLRADPAHGFIQMTDAEALGELLEKQDPRFATDQVMAPLREKIVAALNDFAFNELTVDLSRRGDRTTALTYLSGFGRHGEDPQGLNLTLDLQVQDSFIDLASRIAAKSRIRKATGSALEEFFQEAPAAQENR